MPTSNQEALFNEQFCARTQELRKSRFENADQMADLLGVPPARYRKYETRSPMPPYLIPRFAAIVGVDVQELLTGRSFKKPPLSSRTEAGKGKRQA